MRSRGGAIIHVLSGLAAALGCVAVFYAAFPEYRHAMLKNARDLYAQSFPCTRPLTYSFGAYDERFGISAADFADVTAQAEKTWEDAAGKELFAHRASGGALTVNMVYDERQAATEVLRRLDGTIEANRDDYEGLKAKHDALVAAYEPRKTAYEADSAAHDARVAAYEKEVASWNRRGGAPSREYQRLQQESTAIEASAARLNAERDALNALVEEINGLVNGVNAEAAVLNDAAEEFNEVSGERGEEFEEGVFTGTRGGGRIDIYEFDGRDRLLRLMIHEMGHALGLEHVEAEDAVMYRLNASDRATLHAADVAELRRACELQQKH